MLVVCGVVRETEGCRQSPKATHNPKVAGVSDAPQVAYASRPTAAPLIRAVRAAFAGFPESASFLGILKVTCW